MKQAYKAAGNQVLLVDAGDHIQGTAYGSMDDGETIIDLMNATGYDLATLGNHEFDYGMERALSVIEQANFPYVSCNFYDLVNDKPVLAPYKVFDLGDVKVAFVGITTPESFTKSTPAYFQNEKGEYIYDIFGGQDGKKLYDAAQKAIDAASAEADYVIALGHLGIDPASQPWTSQELIANTTGLDAFIDGHSHSAVPMMEVKDKAGNSVVLTQTGSYFGAIGQMTIGTDGSIHTSLVTDYEDRDATVASMEQAWMDKIQAQLGQVVGTTTVTFDNFDADGNRLVRKYETNTGDFTADALYYLFDNMDLDVDVAVMNGGGIRNTAITGDLSYLDCKAMHVFGNVACLQTVTGQQLLDALEWGARTTEAAECGGFLQVSGLTYEIHSYIPNTVRATDKNVWTGGPTGEYRVRNVKILDKETGKYVPLDLNAKYNLAGYNYTLRDLGDGFAMFDGAVNVLDYVMQDYMVLANYIQSFPKDAETGLPTITAENSPYGDVNGAGRITLVTAPTDITEKSWYYDDVLYCYGKGLMNGMTATTFGPTLTTTRGQLATVLFRMSGEDAPETSADYTDVPAGRYFSDAVAWTTQAGITNGYGDGTFRPNVPVTREEMVTMLYRYAKYKKVDVQNTGNLDKYTDANTVQNYAVDAFTWAVSAGVVKGMSKTTLGPKLTSQRCQLAALLHRLSTVFSKDPVA